MAQPLEIAGSLKRTQKGNSDFYYGNNGVAWNSIAEAKANIPIPVREGKIIGVLENGKVKQYIWHPSDTSDNGLVPYFDINDNATSEEATYSSDKIERTFARIPDGIITEITVSERDVDDNITISAITGDKIQWRIDSSIYETDSPVIINIPDATIGFKRIDLIIANNLNQILRWEGTEDENVAIPQLPIPANSIELFPVSIEGDAVEQPEPPQPPDLSQYLTISAANSTFTKKLLGNFFGNGAFFYPENANIRINNGSAGANISGQFQILLPRIVSAGSVITLEGYIRRWIGPGGICKSIKFKLDFYVYRPSSNPNTTIWETVEAKWDNDEELLEPMPIYFGNNGYTDPSVTQGVIAIGDVGTDWRCKEIDILVERITVHNQLLSESHSKGWSIIRNGNLNTLNRITSSFIKFGGFPYYSTIRGSVYDNASISEELTRIEGKADVAQEDIDALETVVAGKQDILTETNFGEFMDEGLATKVTPSTSDHLLARDSITNEAVEIDISTLPISTPQQNALDLKLDVSAYNDRFKGKYTSLAALQAAVPTANAGDYAQVDAGAGSDVVNYNYDLEEGWIEGGSGSAATTTDELPEGTSNLYFTTARVLATVLSGLNTALTGTIVNTDTILVAFGKLQNQISNLITIAPDAELETQTTPTEDGKLVSKRGLIYWWNWLRTQSITLTNSLTAKSLRVTDFAGTGTRVLVSDSAGNISALYPVTAPVITNTTIISQLTTASNWSAANVYTGTAISGASQMQYYTDSSYFYYFYDDTTPIRIQRNFVAFEATDAESLAGTISNKYLSPARWTYLKTQIQNITNRWQFTGIGLGTAGIAGAFLAFAASTASVASYLLTFGASYTGTANGSVWGESTNWRLRILRNSIASDFLFSFDNFLLKGIGTRAVYTNSLGDIIATDSVEEGFVTDSDVISAIISASYTGSNSYAPTITPVNSKVLYQGQWYYASGNLYYAIDDNIPMLVNKLALTVPSAVTATSYTLGLADAEAIRSINVATTCSLTVPTNASVPFRIGTQITLLQEGTGKINVLPDIGVTLISPENKRFSTIQNSLVVLIKIDTNKWVIGGDIAAS